MQECQLLNNKCQIKVKDTILVEILRKINYNINKEKHYEQRLDPKGSGFMNKDPKVVKELGAGADGYATGGVTIPMTSGKLKQTSSYC